MKISFLEALPAAASVHVVLVGEGTAVEAYAKALAALEGGRIAAAAKAARFAGKRDQVLDLIAFGPKHQRLMLLGIGDAEKATDLQWEQTGGHLAAALIGAKVEEAAVMLSGPAVKPKRRDEALALVASGAMLRAYRFSVHKSKKPEGTELKSLSFVVDDAARARVAFAPLAAVDEGVVLARDLVNEPANVLFPAAFASRLQQLTKLGVKVEILKPAEMKKLGMGALLGVAQGSAFEPRIVVMQWSGGKKGEKPLAFVGKGVTFDTGGVSIKPAAGMEDMKGDMGGAAAVSGLMLALARRKAKANVIGVVGLVENAIDGAAQRPGDIVKSMSGQTIAVLNTDAEGRLVLADVCWYVQDRFKPKYMVDLATLTGAIMIALGKEHAGLFANDDALAKKLIKAGLETGEKVWRMPLSPDYDKVIDHDVADMKNMGTRYGGAITGAQFIQRFVNKVPWAHLDIAGTAFDSAKTPLNPSWGSGWGVRLLNHFVREEE